MCRNFFITHKTNPLKFVQRFEDNWFYILRNVKGIYDAYLKNIL